MAPNNQHHYDTNKYAGDQAADTRRVMNHMPDEDRSTTQEIQQSINQSQATELADGVRMGDDRVIGDTPNWDSFDSEQLYNFATQNNSPTTADDLGRSFNDGGNSLAEAANGLFEAVSRLDGAWSGVAADSAKGALKPLAQAAGTAGQTAQLMGVRMSEQSVAATEVRKLPPAKTFSQEQSLNAMLTGGPVAMQQDLKVQKDAADSVKREQISYLNTYTQAMSSVDAQTPSFVPPQETITGGSGGTTRVSSSDIHTPTTQTPPTRTTTNDTSKDKVKGVTDTHNVNTDIGHVGPTDQTGRTPLPGNTTSAGYTPVNPTSGPNTFGPGGGGGVNTGGPGASGFGPGFGGGFGPGAGAGAGAGAGSGSGANPGSTGPRGMSPAEMSPSRAAGAAERGNQGMGGGPRGKGESEEDQEHERPAYLVEGDPESTFGNDQLTAPPVIGGDD
jgi:hypothetical protein